MNKQKEEKLPKGWSWAIIDDITEPVEQRKLDDENEFTYIEISSIDNKRKRIVEPKKLKATQAPSRAKQRLAANDVLVSLTRPNLNAIAFIPEKLAGSVGSTGFHVLRTKEINPYWLFYFVQTPLFIDSISGLVQGALYPAVRPRDILNHKIPIPPLSEQLRIIQEIDTQFSRLDEAVKSIERMQSNLRKLRVSTLKWACEGKLIPTEAELAQQENRSYEQAAELLGRQLHERYAKWEAEQIIKMQESGKLSQDSKWKTKYNEPVAPNIKNLPELSAGWVWATLEQLASFEPNSITDGPFGSNLKSEHYTSEGPRVIRLQNIGDGVFNNIYTHISQEHFEKLKKHHVKEGDIVIAALGEDLPRACLVPEFVGEAIVKADCIRFAPNTELVSNEYINFVLNSDLVRSRTASIVHGVGRPRLNLTEIKAIALPLPPPAEQKRIVAEVKRRFTIIDALVKVVDTNLQRAENFRRKILQDAFAGKLAEQNPNDESASVLLEKIKIERKRRESESKKELRKKPQTMKQNKIKRRDIIEVLKESKTEMTPEQLFNAAGFNPDEVEEFYAELKKADSTRAIEQKKEKDGDVYLTAKV